MRSQLWSILGVTTLATVLLLLFPGENQAQFFPNGNTGNGLYGWGMGYNYQRYQAYDGPFGQAYGQGFRYSAPYYFGPSTSARDQALSAPAYLNNARGENNLTNDNLSILSEARRVVADNTAGIRITVPPDAEVWFDGKMTKQKGRVREFQTPSLQPGSRYTYQIRARWPNEGHPVDQTRTLKVQANKLSSLDFTKSAKSK